MRKMLLMVLLFLTVLTAGAPAPEKDIEASIKQWLYTSPLSKENLKLAIALNEIIAPEIVFCQSRLETGNFQSQLCSEHNNLFGMRLARRRPTTALGATENNYATYSSWYDSVMDMKLFQEWYEKKGYRLTTHDAREEMVGYFLFLKAIGYAEDPGYLKKLKGLCSL